MTAVFFNLIGLACMYYAGYLRGRRSRILAEQEKINEEIKQLQQRVKGLTLTGALANLDPNSIKIEREVVH